MWVFWRSLLPFLTFILWNITGRLNVQLLGAARRPQSTRNGAGRPAAGLRRPRAGRDRTAGPSQRCPPPTESHPLKASQRYCVVEAASPPTPASPFRSVLLSPRPHAASFVSKNIQRALDPKHVCARLRAPAALGRMRSGVRALQVSVSRRFSAFPAADSLLKHP